VNDFTCVLQESFLRPLLFLGYINDLTKILINNSTPILCADDTGVIITNANIVDFQCNTKVVFIKKKYL
jgi:hypothetical protein